MSWNDLSMADRAAYIKIGLDNGITNLKIIRDIYNRYAKGKVKRAGNFIWRYYGKGI